MGITRRETLQVVTPVATSGFAGCLGGCAQRHEFVLKLRQSDAAAERRIRFDRISSREKEMVNEAIGGEEYSRCVRRRVPDHVDRFEDRVIANRTDGTAYLRKGTADYAIHFKLQDQLLSSY